MYTWMSEYAQSVTTADRPLTLHLPCDRELCWGLYLCHFNLFLQSLINYVLLFVISCIQIHPANFLFPSSVSLHTTFFRPFWFGNEIKHPPPFTLMVLCPSQLSHQDYLITVWIHQKTECFMSTEFLSALCIFITSGTELIHKWVNT